MGLFHTVRGLDTSKQLASFSVLDFIIKKISH